MYHTRWQPEESSRRIEKARDTQLQRPRSQKRQPKAGKRKYEVEIQTATAFTMLWTMVDQLGLPKLIINDIGRAIWEDGKAHATDLAKGVWWKVSEIVRSKPVEEEGDPTTWNTSSSEVPDLLRSETFTESNGTESLTTHWRDPYGRRTSRTCLTCGVTTNEAVATVADSAQAGNLLNISAMSIAALGASYLIWRRRRKLRSWLAKKSTTKLASMSRLNRELSSHRSGRLTSIYV